MVNHTESSDPVEKSPHFLFVMIHYFIWNHNDPYIMIQQVKIKLKSSFLFCITINEK